MRLKRETTRRSHPQHCIIIRTSYRIHRGLITAGESAVSKWPSGRPNAMGRDCKGSHTHKPENAHTQNPCVTSHMFSNVSYEYDMRMETACDFLIPISDITALRIEVHNHQTKSERSCKWLWIEIVHSQASTISYAFLAFTAFIAFLEALWLLPLPPSWPCLLGSEDERNLWECESHSRLTSSSTQRKYAHNKNVDLVK